MPIYEEKLICPLAVRFTQDHIRTYFKDGREVEAAIPQIEAYPGTEGYDYILAAPFPTIEIIRWSQIDTEAVEEDADHWFSLDNRRLYCLQKKAASLWPKKCAARVEVLYAAGHSIRKKDNSLTVGRTVAIRYSSHDGQEDDLWDWRARVLQGAETKLRRALRGITEAEVLEAEELVRFDDRKATTARLVDAPEGPRGLLPNLQGPMATKELPAAAPADGASTDTGSVDAWSASEASTPCASSGKEASASRKSRTTLSRLRQALKGMWTGARSEFYEVSETGEKATWACVRWNANGTRKSYTLWYDETSDCISWGVDWKYYAYASELLEDPGTVRWFGSWGTKSGKPCFVWHCAPEVEKTDDTEKSHVVSQRFKKSFRRGQVRRDA
eukprot:TRINITY_DN77783_c0_g1_i1.p1 TRINITY_DN77783_c0_g1~~TRINITY_DN77783_c0_g1_i1.p1  ORF type:complete len:386 (+),score=82.74 TRINITY_DN77783_c0_g1_i1:107-1264(+)